MRPKTIAICTKTLVKGGAKNGIRLGARNLHEFRTVNITFGDSVGFCEAVMFPGTRVLAQVRLADLVFTVLNMIWVAVAICNYWFC